MTNTHVSPYIVTDPEDTVPEGYESLLAAAEAAGDEHAAATLRWRYNNATASKFCHCDAPGVCRVRDDGCFVVVGDVAPYFWRCAEHVWVPLTVAWVDGVPQWEPER